MIYVKYERFKSRYLLKLKELGLTASEEEVLKVYIAVLVINEHEVKQAKRASKF